MTVKMHAMKALLCFTVAPFMVAIHWGAYAASPSFQSEEKSSSLFGANVPFDVLPNIHSYLDPNSRERVARVSRAWKEASQRAMPIDEVVRKLNHICTEQERSDFLVNEELTDMVDKVFARIETMNQQDLISVKQRISPEGYRNCAWVYHMRSGGVSISSTQSESSVDEAETKYLWRFEQTFKVFESNAPSTTDKSTEREEWAGLIFPTAHGPNNEIEEYMYQRNFVIDDETLKQHLHDIYRILVNHL